MEKTFIEWLQYYSKTPGELFLEAMVENLNKTFEKMQMPKRYILTNGIARLTFIN